MIRYLKFESWIARRHSSCWNFYGQWSDWDASSVSYVNTPFTDLFWEKRRPFLDDLPIFIKMGAHTTIDNLRLSNHLIQPVCTAHNSSIRLQYFLSLRRHGIASALHSASDGSISSDASDAAMKASPQIRNNFITAWTTIFRSNIFWCLFAGFEHRLVFACETLHQLLATQLKTPSRDTALHSPIYLLFPISSLR